MPEKQVYEYAVIRLVPRVEREEFLNVGVIVFCKRRNFLLVNYRLVATRIAAFSDDALDLDESAAYLHTWELIANADPAGGKIARLDAPERFRWLTAPRSTIIQSSKVHVGRCEQPEAVLEDLFRKNVL